MRFEHLDLNLLVALDVLLEERSITRSAERLHMTQSATSGVLKRLRAYFDDELLVQVGRKMQPTPYALELQEPVRDVMLKIRSSIVTRRTFEPSSSKRHFRIVCADFTITILLSNVIQNIEKEAPGITFEMNTPYHEPEAVLSRGDVDFLLVPERYTVDGHPQKLLFSEQHVCVVWQENALIKDTISFDQYIDMGHVSVGFGSSRQLSIEDWFMKQYDVQRRIEVISSDFNTLPQLVVGTNRIATMHQRLAEYYARYLPIRVLPTPVDLPTMHEHLQWHRALENDPLHRWVRNKIEDAAVQL
ncbi:LysR family transcriptional regulator [Pseudomaricurvus alkylphenolicus]|uniref:LysR family transcriptional regulator n=1 Tax=Pseudomaricurvus alkylphenolicus TaxID=1306991 RepID=UPI0014222EA0|nr:LysR family transcriptional regulator [Pseudomaricurvus alkylphenolicus]NIB43423.1 LysR family transcriptional regulator [Pseudomaricurvus alkylphenolicus]